MQTAHRHLRRGAWCSAAGWHGCLTGAALAVLAIASPLGRASENQALALCAQAGGPQVLRLTVRSSQQHTHCDLAALQALPQRVLVTSLPPSLGQPGVHRWQGVSLRLLTERLGAGPGHTLELTALNDYTVRVPWSDLVRYDPIVAYQRDDRALSVRERGPLMLIYPFDAHPELHTQQYLNRSIWQIHAIAIH